ncbi:tetratricopeptide repeat protein [Oceanicoccus sp. KOV_DT_Chl]|uniref:tetratricopeptide repeat protein n=1 Tax=Oceanicoccus sp. KOV_DT_Chl TaxID=1904639 RepID=UPI000C7B3FAC|nr:tetratricopeptide repeat protein [Oceanicoccus sp. KOV_DT_Chl]
MSRFIILVITLLLANFSYGDSGDNDSKAEQEITELDKPLYSPFIERYMLDEVKQLRLDLSAQKVDYTKQIVDREHHSVDRAVAYATDTVTYFFYLVAGATSILVLVGWNSIHEAKTQVQSLADEKISALIKEYEDRLSVIEQQLQQKSKNIDDNREEIELTQNIQSLWLRAAQDIGPSNKIAVYDQILKLREDNCEALTYKADAVLDLGEPQWAINLCQQVLEINPDNDHALYQLGCAYTALEQYDEAIRYLTQAAALVESYREEMAVDPALKPLADFAPFQRLIDHTPEAQV